MAEMASKLTDAHTAVDLPLRVYHGPGSSAAAMLKKMDIKRQLRDTPKGMEMAVAMAFFGGRFENSVIGPVEEELDGWDISSAYPYQMYFLPCQVHGKWSLTKRREDLEGRKHALVRYKLPFGLKSDSSWGPFPFRTDDGSICFPAESGGGWVYLSEYLAGERLFPMVKFVEAWVYETQCDCQPFARPEIGRGIQGYYLYRIELGKDGRGITIKLAVNSGYGKLAQSLGNASFNSWLWAGMITSGCRAQSLELMALVEDLRNVLMVATDGLVLRERIIPPIPQDTGTFTLLNGEKNPKPLGGWELKKIKNGMFFARPGIYFPLQLERGGEEALKKAIKEIKGRGVGRAVILHHYDDILQHWEKTHGSSAVTVTNVSRFCGAKTSVHQSGKPGAFTYSRSRGENGDNSPSYGQWIDRPVELGFNPHPKRERINPDGKTLELRRIPMGMLSTPYDNVLKSKERQDIDQFKDEVSEQPDFDMTEFQDWEDGEL